MAHLPKHFALTMLGGVAKSLSLSVPPYLYLSVSKYFMNEASIIFPFVSEEELKSTQLTSLCGKHFHDFILNVTVRWLGKVERLIIKYLFTFMCCLLGIYIANTA